MKKSIFKKQGTSGVTQTQSIIDYKKVREQDIAIIGIGCRMAGSTNAREFWGTLRDGKDCIEDLPPKRKLDADVFEQLTGHVNRITERRDQAGYLPDIDKFDYKFFQISPKEAALMDPNQRVFLETAWQAIEDAGYGASVIGSQTGVYVGYSSDFGRMYKDMVEEVSPENGEMALAGNVKSIIASRISYLLDFKGPSIVVDTACSSSLVAVYLACQDLRNGKCEMALAGGVKLNSFPEYSRVLRDIGIHSTTNRARSFDQDSDGTGFGEGAGIVVLKPLHRALLDGDHIYAVIKGGALNQDGSSINITAPNMLAQQEVIMEAWQDAQIDPESITYMEAHGTGTVLGDPIEIQAMTQAFRAFTQKKQFCAVSTVKTNIGHLDHAAGIAGLIKAALSLKHKQLPASLHFRSPNRKIDFSNTPVYPNDRLQDWNAGIRRCGVSAFGLSGTNCHLVLEEGPETSLHEERRWQGPYFVTFSAKNLESLRRLATFYADHMIREKPDLESFCYTANRGRFQHTNRIMILFNTHEELVAKLLWLNDHELQNDPDNGIYSNAGSRKYDRLGQPSVLVSQWKEGGGLPVLQQIAESYMAGGDISWASMYRGTVPPAKLSIPTYPFLRTRAWFTDYATKQASVIQHIVELRDTHVYSATISVEHHWFIREHIVNGEYMLPGAAMLHLVKEAYASDKGAGITFRDVIFSHPYIVQEGQPREIQVLIALDNDEERFTVCSKEGSEWFTHAEGTVHRLNQEGPPAGIRIGDVIGRMEQRSVHVFDISNKDIQTGSRWNNVNTVFAGNDEACLLLEQPEILRHEVNDYFIHPALMDNAVHVAMFSDADELFLPWMYKQIEIFRRMPARFYSYIRKKESTLETVTLDILWLDEQGHTIAMITGYCMKRVHRKSKSAEPSLHTVKWVPFLPESSRFGKPETIVAFRMNHSPKAVQLIEYLKSQRHRVIELVIGGSPTDKQPDFYVITRLEDDLHAILGTLRKENIDRILHITGLHDELLTKDNFDKEEHHSVEGLFHLTKAILEQQVRLPIRLTIVACHANEVTGLEKQVNPMHAAICGLGKSIAQEYPDIACRFIDVDEHTTCSRIAEELYSTHSYFQVAIRDDSLYREVLAKAPLAAPSRSILPIREKGTYLITGGLGALGLATASHVAKQSPVHMVLLNRTPIPHREEWHEYKDGQTRTAEVVRALIELEQMGSTVEVYHVNISVEADLADTIQHIYNKYSMINGIFHCAGVAGDGYLIRKSYRQFQEVTAPKIRGTFLLYKLIKQEELDFFLSYSSVTALFGGVGQGDYTAANMFLDSFAPYRNRYYSNTQSVNWPAWKQIGMAHRYNATDDRGIFMDITPEQAFTLLDTMMNRPDLQRVLPGQFNSGLPHEAYKESFIDLNGYTGQRSGGATYKAAAPARIAPARIQRTVTSSADDVAGFVAGLWIDVLGGSDYQYDDNFFEVGGNSIIATTLLNKLQQTYPGAVSITDVFTYPTIQKMAQHIQNKLGLSDDTQRVSDKDDSGQDLEDVLDQLMRGEINLDAAYRKL